MTDAAAAFDAIAGDYDARFGAWRSVAAQRSAVRAELIRTFPPGSRVLEIGGGTGEDAVWLCERGRSVTYTDASPRMTSIAREKLLRTEGSAGAYAVAADDIGSVSLGSDAALQTFDGAYSNFAALNCVRDLRPVAEGLARLLRPGAPALLVLFGALPPGEILVQTAQGRPRAGLRRLARGDVMAGIGGRRFRIRYHRTGTVRGAFTPWFRLVRRVGIGVFVPPSDAEPWISGHPGLLRLLQRLDRHVGRRLPTLADHVLFELVRTSAPLPPARTGGTS